MTDEPMRPDPDRLLEQTAEAHRGKLKIFSAPARVSGKTFAMLTEAQRLRAQGLDILIGVVETHGRKDCCAADGAGDAAAPSVSAIAGGWSRSLILMPPSPAALP